MNPLEFTTDPFGGVSTVDDALPADVETFRRTLNHSIQFWTESGYRLAWLKVPIAKAALIPHAVEAGFAFHHATVEHLMLTRRLREGVFIPGDSTHFIGAGAVVINAANELLVIKESYHVREGRHFYKLPGGLLDPGEHLSTAVLREVFEETGVRTQFESVVCFRHQHGFRFGKSDFYFVCRLAPLSTEINLDPEEIAEARWMPVEEFLSSQQTHAFNQHIVRAAMANKGHAPITIEGYRADPSRVEVFSA
jgi:ADP-ribose pyrophosphatase YjhB (NUDIX family)